MAWQWIGARHLVMVAVIVISILPATRQQVACRYKADVVFVMDVSDSMTAKNVVDQKNFVRDVVQGFHLDPRNGFLVGALAFSARVQEVPMYPFRNYRAFIDALYQLNHDQEGSYTHRALQKLRDHFRVFGRFNVPRIGVVITDGRSKNQFETLREASLAKLLGATMISVGVGVDIDTDELTKMASSSRLVFTVLDQASIRRLSYAIASVICSSTTPGTGTTATSRTTAVQNVTTKSPSSPPTDRPRTTTGKRTPTTRPSTPTNPSSDPCNNCIYTNGVGYAAHPRCDFYYQCFHNDGTASHLVRKCGMRQFWDQKTLTCRPPTQVACSSDPCLDPQRRDYQHPDNCANYWQCGRGRTAELKCCDRGFGYIPGLTGCRFAPFCRQTCQATTPPTTTAPCTLVRDPTNPARYYTSVFGLNIPMACASGTEFSPATCSCSIHARSAPAVMATLR